MHAARTILPAMFLLIALAGAAAADNKTITMAVNGQATEKTDANMPANMSLAYSNLTYWDLKTYGIWYRYIHVRLYLAPNNATSYSNPNALGINYSASTSYIYTEKGNALSCALYCYNHYSTAWAPCSSAQKNDNISIVRCMGYYERSIGLPQTFQLNLTATAPLAQQDTRNIWTGRDYSSYGDSPTQSPASEYWGNTTIATPQVNITNASAPSKQRMNLGQTFYYNITVRNENATNHTGKAYGVFLYAPTDGITLVASTPQSSGIGSNTSQTYALALKSNRTMGQFLLAARDNGTDARATFNSTLNLSTINITDQLLISIREPNNQSYDGGPLVNIAANITDINGNPLTAASAYANITGIKNGVPLYYSGGLYRGNYTINTTQPTPWETAVYAGDPHGNAGANTTLFYDLAAPSVENVSARDTTDTGNATVNASAWDAIGISEVKAQVYWATTGLLKNYTLANYSRNGYSAAIPQPDVVPGTHNVTIFAKDTSGNTNSSARTTFRVNDTTPPRLENISISGSRENESARMNASAWDITNVSAVWAQVSPGANYSMAKLSGNAYSVTLPLLPAGAYNVTIYARDTSGNTNSTAGILRINDSTPPAIAVIRPESGAQTRYGVSQNITANATDNYAGVDSVWAIVDSNLSKRYGLAYENGLYMYNITENLGTHTIMFYANDTSNNTANTSASFTVFLNTTISSLEPSLQSPQNAGMNITWATTLQDGYGEMYYQYNLSRDGGTTWSTAREWNGSSTFTWRTNSSDSGITLVRVYVSNSTSIIGNRTSAPYNISAAYRVEAAQLQHQTYMRGENITFAARAFGAQNNEATGLQATATLAEGQATLTYNGTHYTGTFTVPANATSGNWTANISAQDQYNSGNAMLYFNISSAYSMELLAPYANDTYLRGDSAIVNLTIKNARGEPQYNISMVDAYLAKGGNRKQAVGLTYSGEHYKLYFPFAFNATDGEGQWEVSANASQAGNYGNASGTVILNATLIISAAPLQVEVYNPIRLNFTIDRMDTTRPKENASLGSDAHFMINNTASTTESSAPVIGSTPLTSEYAYDTENNGTSVNRTGQWRLRINISNNRNYGETDTTIQVVDTQNPAAKKVRIGDNYRGRYFENENGAQAYPNDTVQVQAEYIDNFNTTEVNMTITSPSGANATLSLERYWSRECKLGLAQQDCDDAAGSAFRGAAYQISRWNASFSQTGETGNYTIGLLTALDGSGNANSTQPGYSFEIVAMNISISLSPDDTNVSSPVAIAAGVSGNLTSLDYMLINISGAEGATEYRAGFALNYTPSRSDWHTVRVETRSANHLAERTAQFWVSYGTPALTTKLADNQTQLNGTYKTVNMTITASGGDLGNVRIGSTTTNESILRPDFGADTMALLGDIANAQTVTFPFGFSANDTGTVNITMLVMADNARYPELTFTYYNYSIVWVDTTPPEIAYANTTTAGGYANINESARVYAKITDNVEVANASITINCTNTAYNRAGDAMHEDTINAEHVWSYQFNFTGAPANCTFNITATDTSGQEAAPKQATLRTTTAYAATWTKTGAEPLMRGERINLTAVIRTANGNAVEGAAATYNLTRPDGTTSEWAGGYASSYQTLQSDPDGTYTLRANASKYGNAGNYTLSFSANSSLSLDPQYTQEIMRGSQMTFNTSARNARGQNYDATVNLTFLGQTTQLQKTFALYTHTQSVPIATQLGSKNITVLAYSENNTASITLPATIMPANLTIRNLRAYNTARQDLAIGKGDNITVTLELFAQNGESITGANATAATSTGQTINFTSEGGGLYTATATLNVSRNATWTINATAAYGNDNPARAQKSILPINKRWRDVDNDGYQEFAEDPTWLEVYDDYRDTSLYQGVYSTEFYHFPLSPHNGFLVITPMSSSPSIPDKFWSPYDDINTSVTRLDVSTAQGNGPGNPYEYYVDIDGDGNFERQYADGKLNTISGKKLVYGNQTHLYAFDLQNIGRYDKVYDILGDTTIFCGGAKYTVLGYLLGNSEQSEYILGTSNYDKPNLYWDAKTNNKYTIFNDATNSYYVEADGRIGKTDGDLLISTSNGTCSFAIAACGNGQCQSQYGETALTCPTDCASTMPPPPGGGSSPPSGAPAAVQTSKPPTNATEKEKEAEGLDVIIQSPTNLLVTQGNNLTFQITIASTSEEYPLGLSFYTSCCEYSYAPGSLLLQKGRSADVTVQVRTTLLTKAGDYAGEFTVTYRNYTKSRRTDIKVEENPAANEFSALKRDLLLLKESIRQLNQSSPETKKADAEYATILTGIAEAEKALEENDAGRLASIVQQAKARQQGLSDTVKVLMKKQGIEEQKAAIVLPQQQSYFWLIALVTVLVVGSAMSVIFKEQIQQKMFKRPPEEELAERIEELKAEEARISQMKRSTEREYFSRKLDQKTFIHIMSEYESKQIDTKARIAEAQQKLGELTKPKGSGKVEILELQKTPEGRKMLEQIKKIGEWLEKGDYERALETYREALDSYNSICGSLALEEQKFVYEELNKEYANLDEFREVSKKTGDLYSALRNCANCISSEKYDLARHFFEQAESLHRELSRYELFRRNSQHEEIEKLYKQISDFHQSGT